MPFRVLLKLECVRIVIGIVCPLTSQLGNEFGGILPDEGLEDEAHTDVTGPAGIMGIRRRISPVAGRISYGIRLKL
jgi:hypothetical protein